MEEKGKEAITFQRGSQSFMVCAKNGSPFPKSEILQPCCRSLYYKEIPQWPALANVALLSQFFLVRTLIWVMFYQLKIFWLIVQKASLLWALFSASHMAAQRPGERWMQAFQFYRWKKLGKAHSYPNLKLPRFKTQAFWEKKQYYTEKTSSTWYL